MTTPPEGGPSWPYGAPGHRAYGPPPPQHPEATKALVLGIVGLAGGLTCCLPIVVAPIAWVVGHRVVREIDSMPVPQGGRGEAKAGMVLGIIGTIFLGLGLALVLLAVVAGA